MEAIQLAIAVEQLSGSLVQLIKEDTGKVIQLLIAMERIVAIPMPQIHCLLELCVHMANVDGLLKSLRSRFFPVPDVMEKSRDFWFLHATEFGFPCAADHGDLWCLLVPVPQIIKEIVGICGFSVPQFIQLAFSNHNHYRNRNCNRNLDHNHNRNRKRNHDHHHIVGV